MTIAVSDGAHVWEFTNRKTGESRTYEQNELTIDGEVQLFGLINRVILALNERNFPWDRVYALTDPAVGIDWTEVSSLVGLALIEVPSAASEFACIVFGVYPFDEDGKRNKDFDGEKAFIRSCITIPRLTDMLEVFVQQNDYQRLARPFGAAFRQLAEIGTQQMAAKALPAQPEPSTSS